MPTNINLQDITASDNQATLVEKVNSNFNKVLSLGVGSPGPRGFGGGSGGPGPKGLTGDSGPRGSRWYSYSDLGLTLSVKPTDVSFTIPNGFDLQYGDLYTTGLFDVFEYRDIPGVNKWVQIINHNNLVDTTNLQASLVRNFSVSNTDPNSERFVTFIKYNGADKTSSSANPYFNDILFLHNFDQSLVLNDFLGSNIITNFYTSMQTIYVDHSASNGDLQVRNHLELGSFYKVGSTYKITKNNENLKIKYKLDGTVRLVSMNVSKNDGDGPLLGAFNSAFKYSISKYVGSTHNTIDFSLSSTETIRKYTDTTFELIDGLSISRAGSKVAFGIKDQSGVQTLGLIGSTGSGEIAGIYSNIPVLRLGSLNNTAQFKSHTISMLATGQNTIKTTDQNLQITTGRGEYINILDNVIELQVGNGLGGLKVANSGRVGVGRTDITAIGDTIPGASTTNPTASLMVNGSLGVGLRRVSGTSVIGEMNLSDADTTIIINSIPSGATGFNLGSPINATLRLVMIANTTSTTITIYTDSGNIGSLVGNNTALYQSFGSQWLLVMTGSNTLSISGGGTPGIWATMSIINIREDNQIFGTTNTSTRLGDIKIEFFSDINCTLSIPVNNMDVRILCEEIIARDLVTTSTTPTSIFGTADGGNPHIIFPGVLLSLIQIDNSPAGHYDTKVRNYSLQSLGSTPPNCYESDGTTLLGYKKRGEA